MIRYDDLNELAAEIHEVSKSKQFWKDGNCASEECHMPQPRNIGEVLMLMVTELAEAMEAVRDGKLALSWSYHRPADPIQLGNGYDVEINPYGDGNSYFVSQATGNRTLMTHEACLQLGLIAKPEGLPSELADTLIRILDACAAWGIDIEEAVQRKIAYNRTRQIKHGRAL